MLSFVGYNFCSDINSLDPMATMIRNITTTKLANGIFDHFNVSSNTTFDYNHTKPTDWDFETIMDCNFDGNINAGNLEQITADITAVKIKRRVKGTFDWMTIKTVEITKPEDFIFTFNDTTTASGVEYEYAYVPLMANTEGTIVEGEYNIQEILSQFDGVFICDVNTVFKVYAGVEYGSIDQVHQVGTYTALGRKYPIIVSNGLANYKQGTFKGDILSPDYMRNGSFDRADIVKRRDALLAFLNNKKAKVLKDWNGNQFLLYITGNPSVSFAEGSGMGWASVSADWTEVGDPNDRHDMYEAGMIPEED